MKKVFSLFILLALSTAVMAQSETFAKALKKLEYGSTILDAGMLFKKDFPEFRALTKAPVPIDVMANAKDPQTPIKIEAFYFMNDADQELIQLYYVNGKLYEKSVYYYYPKDSIAAVETKYMKCNNLAVSDVNLLAAEGGKVKFSEENLELGKKTHYPIEKVGKQERTGETGYHLVYTPQTGGRGFWVYVRVFKTLGTILDSSMEIPHPQVPEGIYSEAESLLLKKK
jgi:hypothetical protein